MQQTRSIEVIGKEAEALAGLDKAKKFETILHLLEDLKCDAESDQEDMAEETEEHEAMEEYIQLLEHSIDDVTTASERA